MPTQSSLAIDPRGSLLEEFLLGGETSATWSSWIDIQPQPLRQRSPDGLSAGLAQAIWKC